MTDKKKVPFEGPVDSNLWLIGEAPGAEEVKQMRPFVGGAGKTLSSALAQAGIARSATRLCNLCKVRPPKNQFSRLAKEEIEEGLNELKWEVLKHEPNVLVCLGAVPTKYLAGKKGITKWRGSVLWSDELNCKIVLTYHPSFIQRGQWKAMPLMIKDLKKAKAESKFPKLERRERNLIIAPHFNQTMDYIHNLHSAEKLSFDIETTRGETYMTCIGLAPSADEAICIPFVDTKGGSFYSVEQEAALLSSLRKLLTSPSVGKIAQNAQFDMTVLKWRYNIPVSPLILDTMIGWHSVYPELPKSLATQVSVYTDHPYYKHWSSHGSIKLWEYNATDAILTFECAEKLEKDMREFGVWDFYHRFMHDLIFPLIDMQILGVRIEQEVIDVVKEEYITEGDKERAQLLGMLGVDLNVNSPQQVASLLYDKLGLPTKKNKKTGNPTTSKKALRDLASQNPEYSELIDLILSLRHRSKMQGTYFDLGLREGRVHTSYNIGGRIKDPKTGEVVGAPETGRLSSSKSIIFSSGTNLQNIPHGVVRRAFVPDPRKKWARVDLSQAEARVVAYLAESLRMIEVFETGQDIHQLTADAFPSDWDPTKIGEEYKIADNPRRHFAKKHVHAFNYGEGPRTFASHAGIPVALGKRLRNSYFNQFPRIETWHQLMNKKIHKTRLLENPYGRKRAFFSPSGGSLLRQALAYIPQSTVADTLNLALIRLHKWLPSINAQLLLQVHDEFDIQYPPDELPTLLKLIHKACHIPITIHGRTFIIPHEVEIGDNWQDLTAVEEL